MSMAQPLIVVVEAYSAMGLLIDEALTDEGYQVRLWAEGASAAAVIREDQPALIILDLWLRQRGDGLPILDQLWADRATRHIPVIVLVDDTASFPRSRCCHLDGGSTSSKSRLA
jgi:CheY-like chemotaxis protein